MSDAPLDEPHDVVSEPSENDSDSASDSEDGRGSAASSRSSSGTVEAGPHPCGCSSWLGPARVGSVTREAENQGIDPSRLQVHYHYNTYQNFYPRPMPTS